MKWVTLEISRDFLNSLPPENAGTENEIRSGIGIRRTEIGTRMGTDGTRTGNDPGTRGSEVGFGEVLLSPPLCT